MLLAILVPKLATIKNQKFLLIFLQASAILILITEVCLIIFKFNLIYIGILQFLLQLIVTISGSIEIGYIPIILYEDQSEIDKTVNISYVTSSVLTILTGLISSGVIITIGSSLLLILSILLPFIGIFFYLGINYHTPKQEEPNIINDTTEKTYLSLLKGKFYTYTHTLPAFLIILSEAILGGLTGLLLQLLPITMKELGLAVALFPLVSSIQKTGDVCGGLLAPFIKLNAHSFFIIDYIITGGSFIVIGIPGMPDIIRLFFLLISSLTTGLSGNIFEKLMYRSFSSQDMSSMHALVTSTFSLFSLVSYFSSFLKISTLYLWIGTGIFSLIIGLALIIYSHLNSPTITKLNIKEAD